MVSVADIIGFRDSVPDHKTFRLKLAGDPFMSRASNTFLEAIKDAEILLAQFDAINTKPPPPHAEVLKRAGLIMALTAWETYVEDRAAEALEERIKALSGSPFADLIKKKFQKDLKRLNNPNSTKTCNLFMDYLGMDIAQHWTWTNMDVKMVKQRLDDLLAKRGSAVHRSKAAAASPQNGHLVKREELDKGIKFLKTLVERSEKAFTSA